VICLGFEGHSLVCLPCTSNPARAPLGYVIEPFVCGLALSTVILIRQPRRIDEDRWRRARVLGALPDNYLDDLLRNTRKYLRRAGLIGSGAAWH
jgi:hypothetical protein